MKKIFLSVLSVMMVSGCLPLWIGAGATAGYMLSGDSAIGNVETEYRILWDICLDTIESMDAELLNVNESKGLIKSRISDNVVTIVINTATPNSQRLKVSARANLLPKPQFAQKVYLRIVESL